MNDKAKDTAGENGDQGDGGGAFAKDKLFGKRIDNEFAVGQHFLLLGGKIEPEPIATEIGPASLAKLLVQRVNEQDAPIGRPYVVGTLASAIVEKVRNLTPADCPVLVALDVVQSKRFKAKALVMTYVGSTNEDDLAEIAGEFGVDLAEASRATESLRAPGDRLSAGY